MEKNKKQIIAIGLEAAEIDLVQKWAKAGHLPTLSTLMETGLIQRFQAELHGHQLILVYRQQNMEWDFITDN